MFEEEDDQRDQKGPNKWQMRVSVCVFLISPERDWLAGWLCSDETSAAAAGRSGKVVVWRSRKRIGRKGANLIRDGPLTHAALGIVSISRCAQSGRRCSPPFNGRRRIKRSVPPTCLATILDHVPSLRLPGKKMMGLCSLSLHNSRLSYCV